MNKQQTLRSWLHQDNGKNNWGWQVIIDAVGIGESLPLRIIRYDPLQNLYESLANQFQNMPEQQSDLFKLNYPNKAAWDKYVEEVIDWATNYDNEVTESDRTHLKILKDIIKIYPAIAPDIFPVLPANPFPMEMLSRISFDEYRVFCLLWFYYWIIIKDQSPQKGSKPTECNGNALAFPTMNMASQWIDNTVVPSGDDQEIYQNWLIVIGPSFGGNIPMFSEEKYDNEIIDPVVKFIEHFSKGISQERLFHKHRFRRAAHEALPLPWEEMKRLQERIKNALSLLLACDITALDNTPTRHDLYHITLWALFNSLRTHDIKQILAPKESTLIFHYHEDYVSGDVESARAHQRACLAVKLGTDDCMQLSARYESTAPELNEKEVQEQISQYGFVLQFESKSQSDLKKLRIQCSRFYLRVYQKSRSLDGIRLMIISDRLHRELGDNTSSLHGICQWLSGLLRSESTVLYRYDTHERAFGKFSVKDKFSRSPANEKYLTALTQDMENIGTEEELEKSLTYRAVKDNESKICLMYDPETPSAIPKGSTLYHSENNKDSSFRSAVAVPIRFNGRRQGAIEVSAYRPWQFSWGQQVVMEQAASVIAPYFYNQRFLEALSRINHEVLEFHHERLTESELYDEICNALANMFLCDGASFWVCKKNERHILEQKGTHNIKLEISEIDLSQHGFISDMVSTVKKRDSDKSFETNSLSFKKMEWRSTEIESLCIQNVEHLALLPLDEQSSKPCKFMAAVTLYTRDTIGFKDSWNGIMRYMSGFLPFVVEAVNAFVHERKAVTDVVQHEIWHDAAYLVNKATDMARQRNDLRQRLARLITMIQSDWFVNRLSEASILEGWRREDIESIKGLQHAFDAALFLPQEDMRHYAETLRTRINALFNDKDLDKESKKLLSEIGDRSIVDLIKAEEQERPVDLRLIVNRLIEKHSEMKRKGLYFHNEKSPNILARQSIMDTVLRNLLDNAIKYSVNNSAIAFEVEERRSGGLRLIIENEGRAMTDLNECLDVLQKGVRGSNTKTKTGEKDVPGLGMGLYIVQKLCKHVLRFDFSFRAQVMEHRPEVKYIATLDIPANRVVRER